MKRVKRDAHRAGAGDDIEGGAGGGKGDQQAEQADQAGGGEDLSHSGAVRWLFNVK